MLEKALLLLYKVVWSCLFDTCDIQQLYIPIYVTAVTGYRALKIGPAVLLGGGSQRTLGYYYFTAIYISVQILAHFFLFLLGLDTRHLSAQWIRLSQ